MSLEQAFFLSQIIASVDAMLARDKPAAGAPLPSLSIPDGVRSETLT